MRESALFLSVLGVFVCCASRFQVPQSTYRRIVAETGDHYLMPNENKPQKQLSKQVGA